MLQGGFAKCYEMTSLDSGRTYAGKVVPRSSLEKQSAQRKLLNEIKIHKSVVHRNIVKFERWFQGIASVFKYRAWC
jgi:polo-like kinase 1